MPWTLRRTYSIKEKIQHKWIYKESNVIIWLKKTKPYHRLYQYLLGLSGYLSFIGVEFDWLKKESMGL